MFCRPMNRESSALVLLYLPSAPRITQHVLSTVYSDGVYRPATDYTDGGSGFPIITACSAPSEATLAVHLWLDEQTICNNRLSTRPRKGLQI